MSVIVLAPLCTL